MLVLVYLILCSNVRGPGLLTTVTWLPEHLGLFRVKLLLKTTTSLVGRGSTSIVQAAGSHAKNLSKALTQRPRSTAETSEVSKQTEKARLTTIHTSVRVPSWWQKDGWMLSWRGLRPLIVTFRKEAAQTRSSATNASVLEEEGMECADTLSIGSRSGMRSPSGTTAPDQFRLVVAD